MAILTNSNVIDKVFVIMHNLYMPILRKLWVIFVDSLQTLLLAASVFLVIYVFLFRPFQVNGLSMYPNFKDQEYVLTNIIVTHFKTPTYGDVIVFKAPPEPDKDYIKRVIGLPGDTIMVQNGSVYVNNKVLDESSYLSSDVKTYGGQFLQEGQQKTVPAGEYFVLGDNRPESSDSREWGFVPVSYIIGESMLVYWPPQDFQFIKNPTK